MRKTYRAKIEREQKMDNLHAIQVKYLGPTNTLGSRVKLTSLRFGDSVTIDYDYSTVGADITDMAAEWIVSRYGINTKHLTPISHLGFIGRAETLDPDVYLVLINVFEPLKESSS